MRIETILFFILIFSIVSFAETQGTINATATGNVSIVTGPYGATYNQSCTATATCISGDKCILDMADSNGLCVPSSESRCRNNSIWYTSGTYPFCHNNTVRWKCLNSVWSNVACSSGQTCSSGNCTGGTTTTTTSGDGTGTTGTGTTTQTSSITITSSISDFNIIQGESVLKSLTVKSNGDIKLYQISLSLSGIDWYTVSPAEFDSLDVNSSKTFSINFSIPVNATLKSYSVTATVSTNSSAEDSSSFTIKVLPSNETVEKEILPNYEEYLYLVDELEKNITDLRGRGINVTELESILNSIKNKLNETSSSIESEDYFTASQLLEDAKVLIEEFKSKMTAIMTGAQVPEPLDILFIIIVIVILGSVSFLIYLLWPTKTGYQIRKEFKFKKLGEKKKILTSLRENIKKIPEKIKKLIKREKKYKYEFAS